MQLFSEAMLRMKEITDNYEQVVLENIDLRDRNASLIQMAINDKTTKQQAILEEIQTLLQTSPAHNGLAELIEKNNEKIENILLNKTAVEASIILNPVGSKGIDTQLIGNNLNIALTSGFYSNIDSIIASANFSNSNVGVIGTRNQLIYLESDPILAEDDINIYLDDTIKWSNNQMVTIALSPNIDLNGKSVKIFTDKNSLFTNFSYGLAVATVVPTGNKIEVICKSEINYEFVVIS